MGTVFSGLGNGQSDPLVFKYPASKLRRDESRQETPPTSQVKFEVDLLSRKWVSIMGATTLPITLKLVVMARAGPSWALS